MSFELIGTAGLYGYTIACGIYSVKFSTLGYSGGLLKQNGSYLGVIALLVYATVKLQFYTFSI